VDRFRLWQVVILLWMIPNSNLGACSEKVALERLEKVRAKLIETLLQMDQEPSQTPFCQCDAHKENPLCEDLSWLTPGQQQYCENIVRRSIAPILQLNRHPSVVPIQLIQQPMETYFKTGSSVTFQCESFMGLAEPAQVASMTEAFIRLIGSATRRNNVGTAVGQYYLANEI